MWSGEVVKEEVILRCMVSPIVVGNLRRNNRVFWTWREQIFRSNEFGCRSRWPRGLRRRYAAARLLRFWVRIPQGVCMFVCCECCVLSGRGLCDGLITRPEESYRLWWVVVCDLETSWMRRHWPTGEGFRAKKKQTNEFGYRILWD